MEWIVEIKPVDSGWEMRLLDLAELPEPADAADALAIAICHIHTAETQARQGPPQGAAR